MKVAGHAWHIPPLPTRSPVRARPEEAVATAERRLAEVEAGVLLDPPRAPRSPHRQFTLIGLQT